MMPTFTAIALENFLEPNTRYSPPKRPVFPSNEHSPPAPSVTAAAKKPFPPIQYISPALYATPEPASIPGSSPTCVSPSPYVVNHKRRDFHRPSSDGVSIPKQENSTVGVDSIGGGKEEEEEEVSLLSIHCDNNTECPDGGDNNNNINNYDDGDFFDPRESMSALSNSDTEDGYQVGKCMSLQSQRNEFYDASEDFLSDSSVSQSSSIHSNIEADLRAVRLKLFEETERRKKVEESLSLVSNQWLRIANSLSQVGLSFPLDLQVEADLAAHVCQEVVVARFVSEAVERGVAHAEAEAAAEDLIESKNREIARLRDRLQYYEAMNREMSQRNQEVIELARRQRQKRELKRKWIWSCLGLSITVGASLLAYSHFPHSGKNTLPLSDHFSDASSPAMESHGSQT